MGADALSDVLRAVTGAVFFNLDVKAPWVAETKPAGWPASLTGTLLWR